MRVIDADCIIIDELDGLEILKKIEKAGRVCYKSELKITDTSALKFVKTLMASGHESVIEHVNVSVKIICDRGVSHEIVRHRIASYSQESTRYCNYSSDKFDNQLTFIRPSFWINGSEQYRLWEESMKFIEDTYNNMILSGASPEEARSILPNSIKTEMFVTMNLREWRHFFILRTSKRSHPQMREVAKKLLINFKKEIPIIFDDINDD